MLSFLYNYIMSKMKTILHKEFFIPTKNYFFLSFFSLFFFSNLVFGSFKQIQDQYHIIFILFCYNKLK